MATTRRTIIDALCRQFPDYPLTSIVSTIESLDAERFDLLANNLSYPRIYKAPNLPISLDTARAIASESFDPDDPDDHSELLFVAIFEDRNDDKHITVAFMDHYTRYDAWCDCGWDAPNFASVEPDLYDLVREHAKNRSNDGSR